MIHYYTFSFSRHKLEMHLIFFKGSCQTIYEAESTKNGFVTLAYLFNVSKYTENDPTAAYQLPSYTSIYNYNLSGVSYR